MSMCPVTCIVVDVVVLDVVNVVHWQIYLRKRSLFMAGGGGVHSQGSGH